MPRRVEDIRVPDHRSIRDIPVERPAKPRERTRSTTSDIATTPTRSVNKLAKPAPSRARATAKTVPMLPASETLPEPDKESLQHEEKEDIRREEIRAERTEGRIDGVRGNKSAPTNVPNTRVPITLPAERHKKPAAKKKTRVWAWITLGVILLIAGIAFVASLYFAEATFTIVPRTIPIAVDGTYVTVAATTATSSADSSVFAYNIITLRQSASTTVPAVDGAYTSTKATGKVTLYNNFSGTSVRLIAGTRLSDDSGNIYRLSASVVIPGETGTAPKTVPGTVSVSVVSDEAGQQYNLSKSASPQTLSIVAYKGSTKYDTIYAKLSTDISGGYVGTKKTVSPSAIASTTAALTAILTSALTTEGKNAVPADSIAYDTGFLPTFSTGTASDGTANSAVLTVSGTMHVVIFQRTALITRVAGSQVLTQFDGFKYNTPGIEDLSMTIANPKDFSPDKKNNLIVHLKGSMKVVGDIPVDELKQKLAGASLAETQAILGEYNPVMESGSGELIPPWAKVPMDVSHISVKVEQ